MGSAGREKRAPGEVGAPERSGPGELWAGRSRDGRSGGQRDRAGEVGVRERRGPVGLTWVAVTMVTCGSPRKCDGN